MNKIINYTKSLKITNLDQTNARRNEKYLEVTKVSENVYSAKKWRNKIENLKNAILIKY